MLAREECRQRIGRLSQLPIRLVRHDQCAHTLKHILAARPSQLEPHAQKHRVVGKIMPRLSALRKYPLAGFSLRHLVVETKADAPPLQQPYRYAVGIHGAMARRWFNRAHRGPDELGLEKGKIHVRPPLQSLSMSQIGNFLIKFASVAN